MKNKGIFIAVNLLFLIIGVIVGIYLTPSKENKNSTNTQAILTILQNENKWLEAIFDDIIDYSNHAKVDKESGLSMLINDTQKATNSLNDLLKDTSKLEKLDKSTFDAILPNMLDRKTLTNINFNGNMAENEIFINLYKHILLSRFLYEYRKSSLMIEKAKCIVVPKRDTVNIGDTFDASIYFSITGLMSGDIIEMDNGILLKDGHYHEVTKQKGINKRTGIYKWFNGWEIKYWPIEFEFYVK